VLKDKAAEQQLEGQYGVSVTMPELTQGGGPQDG